MSFSKVFHALANDRRMKVLGWLKDPESHFQPQIDGCLVKDGVCALLIAQKLGVSQPTLSEHMRILVQADLVQSKRIKKWTFYKRNETAIRKIRKHLMAEV
jgi:DNA-binding transcriptional ArsR family regulator